VEDGRQGAMGAARVKLGRHVGSLLPCALFDAWHGGEGILESAGRDGEGER